MERRHDIDALRVFAFAFLILYHVAMFYVAEWEWHIKSSYISEWLQYPMLFMNRWRMALLFLLSGIAIGLVNPAGRALGFAGSRTFRLLVPLLFGMFVVVPVQAYCQGVSNGLVAPGYLDFMLRYWTFQPWPRDAFDGWEYGITWNHLWYLAYLWVYTMLLCALMRFSDSRAGTWLRDRLAGLRGARLIVLPMLPFAVYLYTLAHFPSTNDLLNDWFQHAMYFTVFLYGWALGRDRAVWEELVRLRRWTLAIAVTLGLIYVPFVLSLDDDAPIGVLLIARTIRAAYLWTALMAILGWGKACLDRPFRWLPKANEAIFPCYVLHQSLIVLIGYWLAPLKLGPVLEPLLVLAGTVGGCWVIYVSLIRPFNLLRPFFGMKWRQRAAPAASQAATACAS
ncbi:acyltransferase family protein [Tahibacter amnicola]|uniref:Acyltransferase family protein n=1 Tax=Tahibacter amnicola TaxID=2976241 RepID=A0ABY6BFT9_9GAMM|nr:acyltransferase [Tahibacter amnicola]UXI66732.1 acyltransferase family protein [Tahibacter amnicola]